MSRSPEPDPQKIELRSGGFDENAPTPATPSSRPEWDEARHEEALDFHRQQNQRPGMEEAAARRNQYCPKCRGVVDWRAERCPHCAAPIPSELRDYYNFSDFEAPVERSDLGPILTALVLVALVVLGLGFGAYWLLARLF